MFFPTARFAGFMSQLLIGRGRCIVEMHSRKSQSFRTKASDRFRKGNNMVMFSSDVSARGVDYPDVTLIVQVGLTTRAQVLYPIHSPSISHSHQYYRLGSTFIVSVELGAPASQARES